jgi:hypothetical protein
MGAGVIRCAVVNGQVRIDQSRVRLSASGRSQVVPDINQAARD